MYVQPEVLGMAKIFTLCFLSLLPFFYETVGEPLNDEAWKWYYTVVGEGKCTVVDTWWQTGNNIHMC